MDTLFYNLVIATLLISIACFLITVLDNPRYLLVSLLVAYVLVAWHISAFLPGASSLAKLVAGLVACGILFMGLSGSGWGERDGHEHALPTARSFRIAASLLIILASFGLSNSISTLFPELNSLAAQATMILMLSGLLIIGLFDTAFRIGSGLLLILTGFDILYSSIEPSVAVITFLALVQIGIALTISYLLLLNPGNQLQDREEL